jgi:hypothetical protein
VTEPCAALARPRAGVIEVDIPGSAPEGHHHGWTSPAPSAHCISPARSAWVGRRDPARRGAQTRLVFTNMEAMLAAAGMDFEDLVKASAFLINPQDRVAFSPIPSEATGEV